MADRDRGGGDETDITGDDAAGVENSAGVSPASELKVDDGPGEILRFNHTTVVTAGTAVSLIGAGVRTRTVTIKANKDNGNQIYVGGSAVAAATGFPLEASETLTLDVDNAEDEIFIDADTDGESAAWIAVDKAK